LPPSGHNVKRRQFEVGRHFDGWNRHHLLGERGIFDIAARENFGRRMADQFADAQHALRGSGVFLVWTQHGG